MATSDEVKERIIAEFVEGLNHHLFSEKSYPKQVTIKTEYPDCMQTLTIKFD